MPGTGIVFRRLATEAERSRAQQLLQAAGLPSAATPNTDWFGLWDLTAAEGADLVAVATIRPWGPGAVELGALAVGAAARGRGLGRRLLTEVVNRVRAGGADVLVARLHAGGGGPAFLLAAGFRADQTGQDPDRSTVLVRMEL
jgi:GNAT superfamily N-acetyltransferase